ncbi:YbjN domain-containing protein [Sodalinema gerasimenkoae]|uniref:YbjN domain-containing protein n=1 Tax=Sodalinema gerasimenkoae TaxID=2862348 RepID=UPI00135C1314|nr:YbjN domain-containing protein [Sodalinema gerasimenkoae]
MQDNIATDDWTGENDVVNYAQEIETVISSLAQDQKAMVGHEDDAYAWKFKYGSVEVFVQLTGKTEEDTFTVWSPVLKLPATDEAGLMRNLLQMNWGGTFESRFAIVDDQVVVLSSRTVADLNPSEISRAITVVATLADDNDEDLQEKYGAS